EHTAPTMVIIDSYTSIAGQTGRNDDIVTKDYRHIKLLSDLGKEMDVAIVLIHHLKKQSRGDTFTDAFAGTGGLTRAADCLAKIEPDGEVFLLEGKGREIPEYSFAMRKDFRDGTGWYIVAAGDAAKATEAREDIFELLKDEGAHTPSDIARKLGKNGGTVRRLLKKMREASQVQRGGDGKYFNLGREL
ncbi:MAG TPA: winged helix-turn-helix domain-containing protein, partial [Acidobacteriaceae bacterium]|nr:winged helix-turn-helix domain-containing protein [Acidobacteriaceae bacterium]